MEKFDNSKVAKLHIMTGAPIERFYPSIGMWVLIDNPEFYEAHEYRIANGFSFARMYATQLFNEDKDSCIMHCTNPDSMWWIESQDYFKGWIGGGIWYDNHRVNTAS
jgi:hypothetical protein